MPNHYEVRISLRAAGELDEITAYLAQFSSEAGDRTARRLLDAIESLNLLPKRFRVVKSSTEVKGDVHSMPVRPYAIRYRVDDTAKTVDIISIRHGARRPEQ